MAVAVALPLFVVSLAVTLAGARLFARRLDIIGVRFGLSETVIGLLTALAADGPEISAAIIALASGEHAVSAGVVVGSNIFNLAAMVGLSALLAGSVRLTRGALAFEGIAGVLVTLLAAGVLLEVLTPAVALTLLMLLATLYLLLVLGSARPEIRLPLPKGLREGLARVVATRAVQRASQTESRLDDRGQILLIVSDVVAIVLGSLGMVKSAVALGGHWGLSGTLIGVVALGPLTSIPNAQTAVRLGLLSRGAALVSETFASNTINLLGGVLVPALFVEVVGRSRLERLNLLWLAAMTVVCLVGLARREGFNRRWGALLVALYIAFVVFQLVF